jgi:hypothetical protein
MVLLQYGSKILGLAAPDTLAILCQCVADGKTPFVWQTVLSFPRSSVGTHLCAAQAA